MSVDLLRRVGVLMWVLLRGMILRNFGLSGIRVIWFIVVMVLMVWRSLLCVGGFLKMMERLGLGRFCVGRIVWLVSFLMMGSRSLSGREGVLMGLV